ncbi:hypothetical protein EHM69_03750 [candidate division KSB1 bacterium]|nr:MAG: hypothetical protein EHM69_03750 [candidate division KSB1 bacterium]
MTVRPIRIDPALVFIFAAALLLRIPNLGYSFYGDEGFSLLRDSSRLITDSEDRFRPVFFTLLYLWKQMGFHSEIGLRLLPLLFGLAQIPLAYAIGKRVGDVKLARVFAIVMAVSPMLIEFSQELRMYSMVAFIALVQTWLLLKLGERPSLWIWAAFIANAVIGVFTHIYFWMFLCGAAVLLFRERRTLPTRQGFLAFSVILFVYLFNIPNIVNFVQVRGGEYFIHLPSSIPKLLAASTVGYNYFILHDQMLGRPVGVSDLVQNGPLVLLVMIPSLLLLWGFFRLHKRPLSRAVWLCHAFFTLPIILAFISSALTDRYWLQPKYVIFIIPFAHLFVAQAYLAINPRWLRHGAMVLGITAVAIAYAHFLDPQHYGRRENWRDVTAFLKPRMHPNSSLMVIPGSYRLFHYYWPESRTLSAVIDVPPILSPTPEFTSHIRARLVGKAEVYYLWYDIRQNIADSQNILLKTLEELGYNREAMQFNPRLILYRWQLKPS